MLLIELKPETFDYGGRTYTQKRYVTSDYKFFISFDRVNEAKAYKANWKGEAERLYLEGNPQTVEGIKEALEQQQPECEFTLVIHDTQFKNNSKPIL